MARGSKADRRAGDPTVALLLTWLVPGAGHLYLGRLGVALAAFVVIEGMYALGVWFSDGLFLSYLPPEMRGRFAGVLTPEAGNLGALLLHVKSYPYLEQPVRWAATMDLGTTLTSASGVLNLILASRAHLDARLPERSTTPLQDPPVAALASWLVPGAGHVLQGRRARGVAVFVMLVGLFALASLLGEGVNLDRERHFYYWAGQFLLGLPAIVTEFVHGHPRLTHDVAYADAAVVLGCVAGMLNVLVMLDTFGFAEARATGREGLDAPSSDGSSGVGEEVA